MMFDINRYSVRDISIRLFLTCWVVYALFFASNIVREIYPALALGDHLSFRVDEYANMHPDLFEKEGYGWHIGNNPGASMLAAIPYALARPIIDPIVERVNQIRAAQDTEAPPEYESPWPMAREFYREAWERGYDVKFGLAAFVMQAFTMAPSSALGVIAVFYLLHLLLESKRTALGLSLLYAFGTPVFFRTGFLNHNLMLGHFAFLGFLALWNFKERLPWRPRTRFFLGGLAGGTAVLFDYSGLVFFVGLLGYGFFKRLQSHGSKDAIQHSLWFALGATGPIALLWFYQWRSFGNPFLPGQHWMPPVQWIDRGYQGYGPPQLELLLSLAFDYRYGLFATAPVMLLAFLLPFRSRGEKSALPAFEMYFLLIQFLLLWLFFSGSNYTRLQFNTGIRYMAPIFPFLFIPAAIALKGLPWRIQQIVALLSFTLSIPLAMYRDVERGFGVLGPLVRTFLGGFQLPILERLSRLGGFLGEFIPEQVSPLPLFILAGVIVYLIWLPNRKAVD